VCEDFSAIEAAVFAVGGWADGYTNAVLRLLAGLECPRIGLIGPWAHAWPQTGTPGPAIGFLQEMLRWWDRWLKGAENGVMDEPMLRAYLQDPLPPATCYTHVPGRWVSEPTWPPAAAERLRLHLNPGALDERPGASRPVAFSGIQTAGMDAGSWCPYGEIADWPGDQRAMDGMSETFTSQPLERDVDVLGFPQVDLRLSCDRPLGMVSVRLCEVAPDGASTLVTRGQLNLTHRDSHERPAPIDPGRPFSVRFALDACGHRFAAGNRLRLGLSPTYWPFAWPSPEPVTLTLECGSASSLVLPVRPAEPAGSEAPRFRDPEQAAEISQRRLTEGQAGRSIHTDLSTGRSQLVYDWDVGGRFRLPSNGLEFEDRIRAVYSIVEGDPLSACVRCEADGAFGRGDWQTTVRTVSEMTADATHFHVTCSLQAHQGEQLAFEREWRFQVPRDLA